MDYKIAIIIPWFGELPEIYPAWKKSVLSNNTIDFYLFTDNKNAKSEGNLHVHHITFEDYVKKIQDKFEFKITCDHPYKLCDYKPTYGEVFEELLKAYDFWGYCDMDMIFGDIRKFLNKQVLSSHEKIFIDAHLSLFKNNIKMRQLFRSTGEYPEYNIEEAYATNIACYFDEYRGMELKCIRNSIAVYNEHIYKNFNPSDDKFYSGTNSVIGYWDNGQVFSVEKGKKPVEQIYIHICKRKMRCKDNLSENVFCILPGIIRGGGYTDEDFNVSSMNLVGGKKLYKIQWNIQRLLKKIKNESLIDIIRGKKRRIECAAYREKLLKATKK